MQPLGFRAARMPTWYAVRCRMSHAQDMHGNVEGIAWAFCVLVAVCLSGACLSAGGGPMSLRLLLEGESLLNDASSITLFTIFLSEVQDYREHKPASGGEVLGNIVSKMLWLAVGRVVEAHSLLALPLQWPLQGCVHCREGACGIILSQSKWSLHPLNKTAYMSQVLPSCTFCPDPSSHLGQAR